MIDMDQYELNEQLFKAAREGNLTKIKRLVKNGADINATFSIDAAYGGEEDDDKYGMTPLMFFASEGFLTVKKLETFLNLGADINKTVLGFATALIFAAGNDSFNTKLLDAFISHGADINAKDSEKMTALMWTAANGRLTKVLLERFLQHGIDINAQDSSDISALMYKIRNNGSLPDLDILKTFIQNGADINAQDEDGWTPLMILAEYGGLTMELLEFFIEHGVDLKLKNYQEKEIFEYSDCAETLIRLLVQKMDTDPQWAVGFVKKHLKKYLETWVKDGVDGADILVSRLAHRLRQEEFMSEGAGMPDLDLF
jgi:ankyrin repeat protein